MPYTWPVTLQDAKDDTNITNSTTDAELQKFVDAATALLENHPAYRVKEAAASTSYTDWTDAGTDTIVLKHYPVTAVSSVTEYTGGTAQVLNAEPTDGGTFTGLGWDYDDGTGANGVLVRLDGNGIRWWFQGNRVKVIYTAGATSVPADLRLAALVLIDHLWETQRGGSGPGLQPGLEVDGSSGASTGQYGAPFALPNRVKELLEPYRREPRAA